MSSRGNGELSPQEVLKYDGRRRKVAAAIKAIGQGAQQSISYDLKVPASQVSNALSGKYVHPAFLARLEGWLAQQTAEPLPQA